MKKWMNILLPPLFASSLLFDLSCLKEGEKDFTENVKEVYKICDREKIRFLARKYLVQLAFEPCGSNNFLAYTWCPDGKNLYYQLTSGQYILNGETKAVRQIPIQNPTGNPVWINSVVLAYPFFENGRWSIDLYNIETNVLNRVKVEQESIEYLQRGETPDRIYFLAGGMGGKRIFFLDVSTGVTGEAFPEIDRSPSHFSFNAGKGLLAWSDAESGDINILDIPKGKKVKSIKGEKGTFSMDGKFLSVERKGFPVDIYNKKVLTEAEVREKDEKRGLGGLREYIYVPSISIHSLEKGKEMTLDEIHGYKTEWFPIQEGYHLSFVLWGFEREELNRNIALIDLTERAAALDSAGP